MNREFYREFCKNMAFGTPETPDSGVIAGLPMQIPYSTKQGIISAEQGILARDQGISIDELNSSPENDFGSGTLDRTI
jgi:hypothetical protein